MTTNINRNVICVKDLPSNMIEEAIFILKTDINSCKNAKRANQRKELILNETKGFIDSYSLCFEKEREVEEKYKNKHEKLKKGVIATFLAFLFFLVIIMNCNI